MATSIYTLTIIGTIAYFWMFILITFSLIICCKRRMIKSQCYRKKYCKYCKFRKSSCQNLQKFESVNHLNLDGKYFDAKYIFSRLDSSNMELKR